MLFRLSLVENTFMSQSKEVQMFSIDKMFFFYIYKVCFT